MTECFLWLLHSIRPAFAGTVWYPIAIVRVVSRAQLIAEGF